MALPALSLLAVAALVVAGICFGLYREYLNPGPLDASRTIVIQRGVGVMGIAHQLDDAGLVRSAARFAVEVKLFGSGKPLQAGEYAFTPLLSPSGIVRALEDGRTVIHHLTVPEGLTVVQIAALLNEAEMLAGDLPPHLPEEGSLLPEIYNYSYGDTRQALIQRMTRAMNEALQAAWALRQPNSVLTSPRDLLIVASIVERETALESERPRVAAVFLNRLRKGMKLQADPTVAYGVDRDGASPARKLTRADLDADTPYNTYTRDGLPPGPISNPGKAALRAVAEPSRSDALYFVADGSGGHVFSRTLEEHNRHVAEWRRLSQEK